MSGRSNLASSLLLLADQRVEHDDEGEQVEVHQEAELQEHGGNSALVGRQLAPCPTASFCLDRVTLKPSQLSRKIG